MPGRVQGWDVIRGFAVGLVMLTHGFDTVGLEGHGGLGIIGLTAFFVLSGYLITGVLHRDLERHGRIRLRRFYWNRVVRLLPALLVVLVAYAALETALDRTTDPWWISITIGLLYVANLPILHELTGTLRHLWTLAFEEQFYLVWPALLAFVVRRRLAVMATAVLLSGSVLVLLLSSVLSRDAPLRLYTLPSTWAAPILLGCLGYLARERLIARVRPGTRSGAPLLLAAGAVLVTCALTFDHTSLTMYLGGPALAGAAALVVVLWGETWREVRFPLIRPFVWLGTISYAAYLWNYPVTMYLHEVLEAGVWEIALGVLLTIMLATISWFVIEKPAQRWKAGRTAGIDRPRAGSKVICDISYGALLSDAQDPTIWIRGRRCRLLTSLRMVAQAGDARAIVTNEGTRSPMGLIILALGLVLRRRRVLVLTEFLPGTRTGVRGRIVTTCYRLLLTRCCCRIQVMTEWELDDYSVRYRLPRELLEYIAFYDYDDRFPAERAAATRTEPYMFASGRNSCDWETLLRAHASATPDLALVVVCSADDLSIVRRWASPGVRVLADIPREDHDRLMAASAAVLLVLRDAPLSCGHVRLMSAATWSVPVVATRVRGIAGYEHLVTRLVEPGDPESLQAELRMLEKQPMRLHPSRVRREQLQRPRSRYLEELRDFLSLAGASSSHVRTLEQR